MNWKFRHSGWLFGITQQALWCRTVTLVTEFSIRTSQPFKTLIFRTKLYSTFTGCIWATSWENPSYANKKDADQPVLCISFFAVRSLDNIISIDVVPKISRLASFYSWAGRFESYLVANPWIQVFSWRGSFDCQTRVKTVQSTAKQSDKQLYNRIYINHTLYSMNTTKF